MPRIKHSKEALELAVKDAFSMAQVMRNLNLKISGGMHSYLKKKISEYKVDISHFTGSNWNRGLNHIGGPEKLEFEKILVLDRFNGRKENIFRLRRALIESGVEEKCECGLETEWKGKPLRLQVDHRNGNSVDNRKENLRFICPNCHSQTENFAGNKNKMPR